MQMIVLKNRIYFSGKVAEVQAYLAQLAVQYGTVRALIKAKLN